MVFLPDFKSQKCHWQAGMAAMFDLQFLIHAASPNFIVWERQKGRHSARAGA
jgi:hypothetical protein